MKRVVLDTNVLTAGFRSRRGASFALLNLIAEGQLTPLVTTALFLEYEAVLKRPEQIAAHGFSPERVDRLLSAFATLCEPVDVKFRWRPQLADPQDELVLEAAVNSRADALVTYNIKDFAPAAKIFDLLILRPAALLDKPE
ncbi:putative toxin-antitoxin system toxin component, PIN family [Rhizobium sp. BK376]|uniref:putative toxin-antitoxin system toxin component, PIN family n=1 Tax=Rhizobium sp. BK376 TaxID=2512149 RepID=UPI001043C457|nr:putative toxin-antitoxin system toxin component, PIN family [Rhizobium sp. BK376]TCR92073.1 putative PIN family toxin of toxin-antitoxin system [Rhizobium sp. BK376]